MEGFQSICTALTVNELYMNGVEVKDIAKQSKLSVAKIQRMIADVNGAVFFSSCLWLQKRNLAEKAEALRIQPGLCFE